jgi:hypothetical protein
MITSNLTNSNQGGVGNCFNSSDPSDALRTRIRILTPPPPLLEDLTMPKCRTGLRDEAITADPIDLSHKSGWVVSLRPKDRNNNPGGHYFKVDQWLKDHFRGTWHFEGFSREFYLKVGKQETVELLAHAITKTGPVASLDSYLTKNRGCTHPRANEVKGYEGTWGNGLLKGWVPPPESLPNPTYLCNEKEREPLVKADWPNEQGAYGWKVHIAVPPWNYSNDVIAIGSWLYNNFDGNFKYLNGGAPFSEDFTVYIGSRHKMERLVALFEASNLARLPAKSARIGDSDQAVGRTGLIGARFTSNNVRGDYGVHGIPSSPESVDQDREAHRYFFQTREVRDRMIRDFHSALAQRYGEYYLGDSCWCSAVPFLK